MRRSESGSKGSIQEDAIEMRTEVDNLIEIHDIESPNAPSCTATNKSWWSFSSSSTSSYADIVSYFGIRGILLIVLLKVIAIVAFAMIFIGPSNIGSGDFSQVSLVSGRPENLRTLIHTTSKNAAMANKRSLFTLPIANELVYDKYIEFILSYPRNMNAADLDTESVSSSGKEWEEAKDRVSTLDRMSNALEIERIRAGDRELGGDPLSLSSMEAALVVHRFALSSQQQQEQIERELNQKKSVNTMEYSIVLNKFNTVMDHCLIVSDAYLPQLLPLTGSELELWHWTLLQTRAVGFYNSNLLAGASQAHRHVQFVPGDALWALRNPDATHALPIDDVIMPRIESGKWRPYPYTPSAGAKSSKQHYHPAGKDQHLYYERGMLHQLPQFDFQHAVAVLLDRSAFVQYAQPLQAYAEYLQHVYESLLRFNGVSIDDLRLCADDQMDLFPAPPSSTQRRAQVSDDLVSEGDVDQAVSGTEGAHTSKSLRAAPTAVKVRRVDCVADVGYNLLMRPQYMLLVPRSKKDFAGAVSVNSFGYLGMFLATSDVAKQLIKDVGPLTILKSTGRELTQRTIY